MKRFITLLIIALLVVSCKTVPAIPNETKETDRLIETIDQQNDAIKNTSGSAKEEVVKAKDSIESIKPTTDKDSASKESAINHIRNAEEILSTQSTLIDNQKKTITSLQLQHEKDNLEFGKNVMKYESDIKGLGQKINGYRKYSIAVSVIVLGLLAVITIPILRKFKIIP